MSAAGASFSRSRGAARRSSRSSRLHPSLSSPTGRDAPTIRILVVDDHWIVRQGLGLIIEQEPDMDLAGSVASGEEALAVYLRERPDVVLMDLLLPGMDGVDAISAIRRADADARIIVLTMHDGDECIHRAL